MVEKTDIQQEDIHEHADEQIVVMTDESGNEFYYIEDTVIDVDDKKFAMLISITEEELNSGDIKEAEEANVFVAKIEINEDGEAIYVDPSDEEFQAFQKVYEQMFSDEE